MDLNGNASAGVGKYRVVGESNSKTPMMGRNNDEREVNEVVKVAKKGKTKSGGGNGSGCAAEPSCSKKKFVLSTLKQKLCYLKDEKLLKEFDQYWICQECGHFFDKKDSLWSHVHDHLYHYNCKQCTEPGSQELKSASVRNHIRKCHPLIDRLSDGYTRKKALDWDDVVIASKTKRKNFLTVEQLRNSNPDKYDQLKNLTFGIKRANSHEELAGGGGAVGRVGYSLKARAKVTQTGEDEDDFVDILGVDEDGTTIAPVNLCELIWTPESETPTTSVVAVTAGCSSVTAMAFNECHDHHDEYERPSITVDEITLEPEESLQIPRIREKRKSSETQNNLVALRLLGEDYDYIVDTELRPTSRIRRSGGEKKKAKGPEVPSPGQSVVDDVAVAGPSQPVNQTEIERQISEWSRPQEVSLTLTLQNANGCEEKAGSNDDASLKGAPLITDQEEGEGQGSSGTGRISHPLTEVNGIGEESVAGAAMVIVKQGRTGSETLSVAESEVSSIASSVREIATPLMGDNQEKLKKKKKKVKGKEDKK